MNATQLPFSKRMFRALLRVLPADFRSDYGREMEYAFDDQEREARDRSGAVGVVRVWWETLAGIFTTAPREHWEMLQQDTGYALRTMRKNIGFTCLAVLTRSLRRCKENSFSPVSSLSLEDHAQMGRRSSGQTLCAKSTNRSLSHRSRRPWTTTPVFIEG